jgi:hypothetical protein
MPGFHSQYASCGSEIVLIVDELGCTEISTDPHALEDRRKRNKGLSGCKFAMCLVGCTQKDEPERLSRERSPCTRLSLETPAAAHSSAMETNKGLSS